MSNYIFYYLYILSGPLKGTKTSLSSHHYSILLYNGENRRNSEHKNKINLYIPFDDDFSNVNIDIKLDQENDNDNFFIINNNKLVKEKTEKLTLDNPIYLNDIPILLISKSDNININELNFSLNKMKVKTYSTVSIFIFTLTLTLFILYYLLKDNKFIDETVDIPIQLSPLNYKGENNHLCLYDDSVPEWIKTENREGEYIYVDINKVKNSLISRQHKINHLILSDKEKPKVIFIYQNEIEKEKEINAIQHQFPDNCYPEIISISMNNLINEINKISFIQKSDYEIKKDKNRLVLIFNSNLSYQDKSTLNQFIKKQTSFFGRKFIFYQENIGKSELQNKTMLQESKGYIFIDNKHLYFPNG